MKSLNFVDCSWLVHGKNKITNQTGFTLIEVLLVTTIILILTVSASGFYSRFLTQNAVSNTTDQLIQSIRKAQIYAMTSHKSNSLNWGVNWTSPTITLYRDNTFTGHIASSLDEKFTVNPNIIITGMGDFNFTRLTGKPALNGSPVATTITVTISSTSTGTSKTITINNQGMITR